MTYNSAYTQPLNLTLIFHALLCNTRQTNKSSQDHHLLQNLTERSTLTTHGNPIFIFIPLRNFMLRILIELFLCLDKSICWLKKLLLPRWLLARKASNAPLARKTVNAPRGKLKIISEFTPLRSTQPIFKVTSYLGQYYTQ